MRILIRFWHCLRWRPILAKELTMANKDKLLTQEELLRETKKLAADLAFCARAPVTIALTGGDSIAYTYNADDDNKQHTVPIVINPSILGAVRNKARAIRIWRGIGFHELAHHLWPASAQYKQARKEGFKDLFNLIDDEQNERRGRAFDESWGACFQSVCAHIFPPRPKDDEEAGLNTGIVDGGEKPRKPRGIGALRPYIKRWNAFAVHLRRHVPDPQDPVVAEALALIDSRFKDLSKEQLLDLTRQVHQVLSRGIEMPKAVEGQPSGKPQDPSEEDVEDDETPPAPSQPEPAKDSEPEEPDPEVDADPIGWDLRAMLRSKWLWATFLTFIVGWSALLLTGGVTTWVRVAIEMVIVLAVVTAFLFLRRAYIKKLIARVKEALNNSSFSAPPPPKVSGPVKAVLCSVVGIGIAGLLGWLSVICAHKFGSSITALAVSLIMLFTLLIAAWKVKQHADAEKEGVNKWVLMGFAAIGLMSMGGLFYSMDEFGLSGWLKFPLLGLAFFPLSFGALYLCDRADKKGYRKRSLIGRVADSFVDRWHAFLDILLSIWLAIWRPICGFFRFIWRQIVRAYKFIKYLLTRGWWRAHPHFLRLWRNTFFRLAALSLPIALLLVMAYSVLATAGKTSWWLLLLLLLLMLGAGVLGWIFRSKIKKFVLNELFMPMPSLMDYNMQVPLDMETDWFVQVDNVQPVQADQKLLEEMLPEVHALAQQLRPYLERCGRQTIDREDQPDGFDLIEEAELALVGESSIFINDDTEPRASVHFEVALDCSTSMTSATQSLKPGEKFILGKFFALVLEQAVLNLPGVSARFWGFTDSTIFDCGVPGEGRITGLTIGGGNNDAAMLWHMGQSAAASGKDIKILLMLSDGQPSDCSWLSLRNLVLKFEQEGMIPWNFALDVIQIPAFERFFTDLVGQSREEAIVTMGTILAAIAEEGIS
jgi:hypothetical protein